jgi:sortase A
VQTTRPVDVPDDPYAREPLVELGLIEIPKIGLRHRLFQGITLGTIDRGPAHWPGSAYPGQIGNAVIAGHRVTHSKPFRHIDRLVPGDEVSFVVNGTRTVYRVTGHEVVTPKDTWIANPTPGATATLFACHPPGSAKLRYVVRLVLAGSGPA